MYPKIVDVKVEDEYILIVAFDNQTIKKLDLSSKLSDLRFQSLKDKILFNNVRVDPGGYGISWNDYIDMSEYELWNEGEVIN